MTIRANKNADSHEATPRTFDVLSTSFDSPDYENPYLGGMLFRVSFEYTVATDTSIETGTTHEYVLCASWQDLIDTLPKVAKYVAENWTRDEAAVKVIGAEVVSTDVQMSDKYSEFLRSELSGATDDTQP